MEKLDLQKQATMLIKQLSTEKLKEVVDYLADLQGKDADNILPTSYPQEIPEKGLGTFIHKLFKQIGTGVFLNLRYPLENQCENHRVLTNVFEYEKTEHANTTKNALGWAFQHEPHHRDSSLHTLY